MSATSETRFSVEASSGSYDVRIEVGLLSRQVAGGAYRAAITDARFADRAGDIPVVAVEATESKKTLSTVEDVIVRLARAGVHRGDHVLAVGGGMLQDVATLAASLFMRGLEWTYAPTTLMAMADSCIGGKSSINAGALKNLVGNIYP